MILLLAYDAAPAAPSPSPAATAVAASGAPAASKVRLPDVVINGVRFSAVEYPSQPVLIRNLAITVKPELVPRWVALPQVEKAKYAQQMIALYKSGMHYNGNVRLSFIDDHSLTLDQYLFLEHPLALH